MLAETREQPFSRPGWVFEVKLDGYRMRVAREGGVARLVTRNGNDYTAAFPELARAVQALPYDGLVMDGELVILDEQGRPSFQRLQNRARVSRAPDIRHAAVEHPATVYLFDLVALEGFDLRSLPLVKRKALLHKLLPEAGPLRYSEHFEKDGEVLYDQAVGLGLEGIVAKKSDAPYKSGRSDLWLKIRADKTSDFVVAGPPRPRDRAAGSAPCTSRPTRTAHSCTWVGRGAASLRNN
jgi:bifunctional non-homologous end joining protein LigD